MTFDSPFQVSLYLYLPEDLLSIVYYEPPVFHGKQHLRYRPPSFLSSRFSFSALIFGFRYLLISGVYEGFEVSIQG